MILLKYGNTNTFLIPGSGGYLLLDTDYAGKLPAFFRSVRQAGIKVSDISFVMATHYHPDHMGLIPELIKQGTKEQKTPSPCFRRRVSDTCSVLFQ